MYQNQYTWVEAWLALHKQTRNTDAVTETEKRNVSPNHLVLAMPFYAKNQGATRSQMQQLLCTNDPFFSLARRANQQRSLSLPSTGFRLGYSLPNAETVIYLKVFVR